VLVAVFAAVADVRTELVQPTDGHRHVAALLTADQEVEHGGRLLRRRAGKVELDAGEREPQRHATVVDAAVPLDRQRRRRHRHAHVHGREALVVLLRHRTLSDTNRALDTRQSSGNDACQVL